MIGTNVNNISSSSSSSQMSMSIEHTQECSHLVNTLFVYSNSIVEFVEKITINIIYVARFHTSNIYTVFRCFDEHFFN